MTRRHILVVILLLMAAYAHTASADDRLEQIMMGWVSPDYAALRVQIDEALIAYREAGDPKREAIAYLFLSIVDVHAGDVEMTRAHLGEATTRFEGSKDFVGAWLAYWMLAEHERLLQRQSDDVLAFYEKSFAMLEQAKAPGAPFSIDALMVIGPIMGLPPAEYEPRGEAPDVHKRTVLQLLEVFSRTGYGAEFLRVGEIERADVELRRAKEAAALFQGRLDPPIDRGIGSVRRRQGRLDEARESYSKALEDLQVLRPVGSITPARLRVEILRDLSEVEMRSGRIEDALAWNDRALELVSVPTGDEAKAAVLQSRAEILGRAGRFSDAEQAFAQALAIAETNELFDQQVSIRLSRAQMNGTRGRYGASIADVEKSLEALANSNQPIREPAIWANLAMAYVRLGANESGRLTLEKARKLAEIHGRCLDVANIDLIEATRKFTTDEISLADFNNAIEQWTRTPDVMSVTGMDHFAQLMVALTGVAPDDPEGAVRSGVVAAGMPELLQAAALFSQGRDFAEARALAMKALPLLPNLKHRASALMMIGGAYLAEGNDPEAIAYLGNALSALDTASEDASVDPLLSESSFGGWPSTAVDLLIALLVKHQRYEEALAVAEHARARVFLQLLGNNRVSPRGRENTLAAQEAEALRMQLQRQRVGDLREDRQRYEALMTRVQASNPEYAAMTTVAPLQLDAIRAELPADTTLLSYFATEKGAHAWVLDRTTLEYVALPFGPKGIERARCAAKQFRGGGRGVRPVEAPCEPAPAEELYGRLIAPLRAHLHNPRLIIVPYGVLHSLPFAAFRDSRTQRHLIEDFTITYAPSASAIRFLRDKETPVNGKALVIGAPAGVQPELPYALREAMVVGTELRSPPRIGDAAKESLLYQLKGDVDLIHIAAHGFYEPDTPLFSRLALTAGDGSDGNLEVHEILSDVDLTGVNLVVLSACQTALGKTSAGDEIAGLTRALLYAGTPGVISTLWDIPDDAAAALMDDFYCRLLRGDSPADALRHAQLELLHGDYPDPRQWAAFTLSGDPEGRWNGSGAITNTGQ